MVRSEGDYGDVAVKLKAIVAKTKEGKKGADFDFFENPFSDVVLTLDSIVEAALKMNSITGYDSV